MLAKYFKFNLLGKVIPLMVAFFSIPFILNKLGNEAFGILAIFWALVGYSSMMDLGVSKTMIKFVSTLNELNKLSRAVFYVWTGALVQLIIGFIISLVIFILSDSLMNALASDKVSQEDLNIMLFMLIMSIPLLQVTGSFRGFIEGLERFKLLNIIRTPLASAMYFLPAFILIFSDNMVVIIGSIILIKILELIIFVIVCVIIDKNFLSIKVKRSLFREIIGYGYWIMISNILNTLFMVVDKVIIATVVGIASVTVFVIPMEVTSRLLIASGVLTASIFPFISRKFNQPSEVGKGTGELVFDLMFFYGVFFVFVFVSGETFLKAWVGEGASDEMYMVFKVLSVGLFFNALAFIPLSVHQGLNKPNIPALGNLAELPIYLSSLYYALDLYGVIGAAVVWSLRVILDSIYLYFMMWRLYQIPVFYFRNGNLQTVIFYLLFLVTGLVLSKHLFSGIEVLIADGILILILMKKYHSKRSSLYQSII